MSTREHVWARMSLLVALTFWACGDDGEPSALPVDFRVTMQRGFCFGQCPVYAVDVDASGHVTFEGERFVEVVGQTEGTISRDALLELKAAFDDADFFSLQNCYVPDLFGGGAGCGQDDCADWFWDAETVVTTLEANGSRKRVEHYHGCHEISVLDELSRLEDAIDTIVNTCPWVGTRWPFHPCSRAHVSSAGAEQGHAGRRAKDARG